MYQNGSGVQHFLRGKFVRSIKCIWLLPIVVSSVSRFLTSLISLAPSLSHALDLEVVVTVCGDLLVNGIHHAFNLLKCFARH